MYSFVSNFSYIFRFLFCLFTIEQYPVFSNEAIQWIFSQAFWLYSILRVICYGITGDSATNLGIKSPTWRSIIYFLAYMVLATITYWILRLLTKSNILPF